MADIRNVDMLLHNTRCDVANGFRMMGPNENMPTVVQSQFGMQGIPYPQPGHGTQHMARTRLSPLNYSFQLSAGCLAGRCFGGSAVLMVAARGSRGWNLVGFIQAD